MWLQLLGTDVNLSLRGGGGGGAGSRTFVGVVGGEAGEEVAGDMGGQVDDFARPLLLPEPPV